MQKIYFIPGTMCTAALWSSMHAVAHNYTPIYIDTTAATSFDEINAIIDSTLTEPSIIVGFSMGGFAAMYFALKHPEKVRKLIVVSATPFGLSERELSLRKSTLEFLEKHPYKGISQQRIAQFIHPSQIGNTPLIALIKKMDKDLGKEILIRQLKATSSRTDISEALKKSTVPILFVLAAQDSLVNPAPVKELYPTIPKARYMLLKGSGHMIPLEKPEVLTTIIERFSEAL